MGSLRLLAGTLLGGLPGLAFGDLAIVGSLRLLAGALFRCLPGLAFSDLAVVRALCFLAGALLGALPGLPLGGLAVAGSLRLLTGALLGGLLLIAFGRFACAVSLGFLALLPVRGFVGPLPRRLPIALLLQCIATALFRGLALAARFGFTRPHCGFVRAFGGLALVPFHRLASPLLDRVPSLLQFKDAGPVLKAELRVGVPLVARMLMTLVLLLQQAPRKIELRLRAAGRGKTPLPLDPLQLTASRLIVPQSRRSVVRVDLLARFALLGLGAARLLLGLAPARFDGAFGLSALSLLPLLRDVHGPLTRLFCAQTRGAGCRRLAASRLTGHTIWPALVRLALVRLALVGPARLGAAAHCASRRRLAASRRRRLAGPGRPRAVRLRSLCRRRQPQRRCSSHTGRGGSRLGLAAAGRGRHLIGLLSLARA